MIFDDNSSYTHSTDFTVKYEYISNYILIFDCLGGYRERETPGSIPNPEAKPLFADNTYPFRIGNVGRCLVDRFFNLTHILLLFYNHNQLLINLIYIPILLLLYN